MTKAQLAQKLCEAAGTIKVLQQCSRDDAERIAKLVEILAEKVASKKRDLSKLTCATCGHFRPDSEECRRYPPSTRWYSEVDVDGRSGWFTVAPNVIESTAACGEYTERSES